MWSLTCPPAWFTGNMLGSGHCICPSGRLNRGSGVDENRSAPSDVNSAECEIVFVEFLGDLVKLHLLAGGERMLAKVSAEHYPSLRGREGERVRISWKEEDVQLLDT